MKLLTNAFLACMAAISCTQQENLCDYVDPMIGTAHSRWFFFTPAAVPFGMAKLAPTTDGHYGNPSGWEAVGYDFRHTSIEGFASFHEFQVGGIVVAPVTGEIQTVPGSTENPDSGYRSRFDKKDETARPGYYSVLLKDYGVFAELTATERVGFQRYTFPKDSDAALIFNIGTRMGESGPCTDAYVTYAGNGLVEGWVETQPMYTDIYQDGARLKMYFSAELDAEPESYGTFVNDVTKLKTCNTPDGTEEVSAPLEEGNAEVSGAGAGMYFRFGTSSDNDVEVKMGLSYTSVENARANREAEASGLDFDSARKRAENIWEESLGRIRVEGKENLLPARLVGYDAVYGIKDNLGLHVAVPGHESSHMAQGKVHGLARAWQKMPAKGCQHRVVHHATYCVVLVQIRPGSHVVLCQGLPHAKREKRKKEQDWHQGQNADPDAHGSSSTHELFSPLVCCFWDKSEMRLVHLYARKRIVEISKLCVREGNGCSPQVFL